MQRLVTVVTVCFNAATAIGRTLESVVAQTYPRIEYLIIDGGSSDGTLGVVSEYEPRFGGSLHWSSEPDSGIYDAMNKGARLAKGEYLAFVNAGDRFEPDAIERLVAAATASHSDIAYGGMYQHGGSLGDRSEYRAPQPMSLNPLMRAMPACHEAMLFRRDLHERVGYYSLDFDVAADYEFVLRCLAAGAKTVAVDAPIVHYELGGTSDQDAPAVEREYSAVRKRYGADPVSETLRSERSIMTGRVYRAAVAIPLLGSVARAVYQRRKRKQDN